METTPGTSQIKDKPSDDNKISNDINLVKLDALTQGKFTDCVFLVGSDDDIQEEVHALKGVLMMASAYMEGLFRSPFCPSGPIRIKDVKPKIFKLVVEFVLLGQLKTLVKCEDLLELLIAADLYLIDSLKIMCIKMLKRDLNASAVWLTLQKLLKIDHLKSEALKLCIPLLTKKTKECLEHETFLAATSESVNLLLQQDTLDLQSENQVVHYCLKWAQHQINPKKSFREVFGHLRLLQLTPKQLDDLPQYFLTQNEKQAIFNVFLKLGEATNLPSTLCSISSPRKFRLSLKRKHSTASGKQEVSHMNLIPNIMLAKSNLNLERNEKFSTASSIRNTLRVTPKLDIYLTKLYVLNNIPDRPLIIYDKVLSRYVSKPRENVSTISVFIAKNGVNLGIYQLDKVPYKSMVGLRLSTAALLPKGETTKLEIKFSMASPSVFRNILCQDVNAFVQKNLDTEVFESIHAKVSNKAPFCVEKIMYIVEI